MMSLFLSKSGRDVFRDHLTTYSHHFFRPETHGGFLLVLDVKPFTLTLFFLHVQKKFKVYEKLVYTGLVCCFV
jgi:hypothetical protein